MQALIDIIPLIVFFIVYKFYNIKIATLALLISTFLTLITARLLKKKISKMNVVGFIILLVFSSLTLYTNDDRFIKIKPTIAYLVFASVFVFGISIKKYFASVLFQKVLECTEKQWKNISISCSIFLLVMAILNEIVWRTMPLDFWVNYKVIFSPFILIAFFISIFIKYRHNIKTRN